MKLTKTKGARRQNRKNWIEREEEKVFIIWPRRVQDGSLRAMETVRRKTAIKYGHSYYTSFSSASDLAIRAGDKKYVYGAVRDQRAVSAKIRDAFVRLMKPITDT